MGLMSQGVLYDFEEPVRGTCLVLLLGFGGFWFGFFGYGLIVNRQPFTVASAIGTGVFVLLVSVLAAYLVKGGVWRLEVSDDAVRWHGPFEGDTLIRDEDVESFEVVVSGGDSGASPSTHVLLKSGETVILPKIGDQQVVHKLLLTKWNYRGKRTI